MHYRNGTPVELGDKVTIDEETTPADIHGGATGSFARVPDCFKTPSGRQQFTGVVAGRDTKGTCGVAVLQITGEIPRHAGYAVICTQSQEPSLFLIEGRMSTIHPAYLKKLA